VPGCIVVDHFDDGVVRRVFSLNTDLSAITPSLVRRLLDALGRFRYDPLEPFKALKSRTGLLARKEFLGLSEPDKNALREYRESISGEQLANGSWRDSAVYTGFSLIRLLETGLTLRNRSVRQGADWLLTCGEPFGRPGLWMFSERLVQQFNRSREKRPHIRVPHRFRRGHSPELRAFLENSDVSGLCYAFCGPKTMYSTGVTLEALLRCGLEEEPRVVRALNSLRELPWCEGGLGTAPAVRPCESTKSVDLSGPAFGRHAYDVKKSGREWFVSKRQALKLARVGRFDCVQIGRNQALWVQRKGYGACGAMIERALSFHPAWRGSPMAALIALGAAGRQSWDGSWGSHPSFALSFLERHRSPMAAFAVVRTIAMLIREQRPDGLWQESRTVRPEAACWYRDLIPDGCLPPPSPEESSYLILRALNRFGFLDALLPREARDAR
jgi:hypothetical protein